MTFRIDHDALKPCKRCGRLTCEVASITATYDRRLRVIGFKAGRSRQNALDRMQALEDAVTAAQNRCTENQKTEPTLMEMLRQVRDRKHTDKVTLQVEREYVPPGLQGWKT